MTANTVDEIWKPVPGYEAYAEVSSLKRIRNVRTGRIYYNKRWALYYKGSYVVISAFALFPLLFPDLIKPQKHKKQKVNQATPSTIKQVTHTNVSPGKPSPFRLRGDVNERLVLQEWNKFSQIENTHKKEALIILFSKFADYFFAKYPELKTLAT